MANDPQLDGLVTTDWLANRLADPQVRVAEVDIDMAAYDEGHIPGAVAYLSIPTLLRQVQAAVTRSSAFVDVGLPGTCQRGGHIPHARNIPWGKAVNDDGTFKSFDELKALYAGEGIGGLNPVIRYCRIGERSSHTWFVLKHLLGYRDVVNYDGSWTEWGNLVGALVERGAAEKAAA